MELEHYLNKIRAAFPQLQWNSYKFLEHGWDHLVVILDEKIVFRFPKEVSYQQALIHEIQLLAYLKKKIKQTQLTVGIPDYTYLSADKSFAGYSLVQGKELGLNPFQALSSPEKDIVAGQLAAFLAVLHATPTSAIRKYKIEPEDQVVLSEILLHESEKYLFPRLNRYDITRIESFIVELEKANEQFYQPVLIHNDLTSEHILWDPYQGQVNIIDFSDRAYGDPALDFAGLLEYGHLFTSKVMEHYTGKKDDQLLFRARLYYKRMAIWLMIDAIKGFACTFEQGYAQFQERFRE